MSETQIRAFMIADNKLTELGNWDRRLLAQQFKTLSEVDLNFNLESTGFDLREIELLIGGVSPLDGDKSDVTDKLPPPSQVVCVSKPGDCWRRRSRGSQLSKSGPEAYLLI